jgi:transcription initiation factor TFIIB
MLAMRLLEEAINNNFTNGRSSAGIAAVCIYISSRIMDEGLTQCLVAYEAQVTEVTIRNRYKELLRNLDIVILV